MSDFVPDPDAPRERIFLPFFVGGPHGGERVPEAQRFSTQITFTPRLTWEVRHVSSQRPPDVPRQPDIVYVVDGLARERHSRELTFFRYAAADRELMREAAWQMALNLIEVGARVRDLLDTLPR